MKKHNRNFEDEEIFFHNFHFSSAEMHSHHGFASCAENVPDKCQNDQNLKNCPDIVIRTTRSFFENKFPKNVPTNKFHTNKKYCLINKTEFVKFKFKFLDNDLIHTLVKQNPKIFMEWVKILNKKRVIFVGPKYLSKIKFIKYEKFIEIPIKNCYKKMEEITTNISNYLNNNLIYYAQLNK